MPPFSYLRELPPALRHFAVVKIPLLVTNDPGMPWLGVFRNAYVEVSGEGRIVTPISFSGTRGPGPI